MAKALQSSTLHFQQSTPDNVYPKILHQIRALVRLRGHEFPFYSFAPEKGEILRLSKIGRGSRLGGLVCTITCTVLLQTSFYKRAPLYPWSAGTGRSTRLDERIFTFATANARGR